MPCGLAVTTMPEVGVCLPVRAVDDDPLDVVTITIGPLPPWPQVWPSAATICPPYPAAPSPGTIPPGNPAQGSFFARPLFAHLGATPFTFTATDQAGLSATCIVTIQVNP